MPRGIALGRRETIAALASRHGGEVDEGCVRSRRVDRLVAPGDCRGESDLVVLTSARKLGKLGRADAVLCSRDLAGRLPRGSRWVHDHVMWVVAGMVPAPQREPAFDSPGVVDVDEDVAADAVVESNAVIMRGAVIGAGCTIGAGAVIYGCVRLGRRVVVGANAVVGRPGFGWASGPDGSVRRVPQLGGVEVGDDVEIGPLCTIDAGTFGPTRIASRTKLDAQVHVGHNVSIGPGTFVAAQAGFAGSVVIGAGVLVGGQAGVADHASVGDRAKVSAKAGVIGRIPEDAVVAGFPAVSRIRWWRAMARLVGRRK